MRHPKTLELIQPTVTRQSRQAHVRHAGDPVLTMATQVGAAPAEITTADRGRPRLIVRVFEEAELATLSPSEAATARQAQTWLLTSAGILNKIRRESRTIKAL